ncbi:TlpA disulfide reductase family protein [Dinghuibacter silviterrae]|uniref:Peroxiredoxin n=1 Tax=Dinghuibacter silviterrae TaxID=1539049 RepID=A0A4R8DFA2_9BACT|nr:TlpA disulfide reductase family protein [Dinghuibacter silviterrae]TDW96259.1 peroxiredoxin [Dinghuibacter silviterrae]
MKMTFVLLFTVIFASAQQHRFSLEGTLKGKNDGFIYMRYAGGKGEYRNDSALITDGHFRFTGRTGGPAIAFLTTVEKSLPDDDKRITKADGKNAVLFFLEPGAMEVVLDTSDFKDGRFTGSKTQMDFAAFREQNALPRFVEQYPNSYASAYLLSFHHFPLDTLKYLYNSLTATVQKCTYGKIVLKNIERKERVAVGKYAPSFRQKDRNGNPVSLKDFSGHYVLLEFWSSWNSASQKENQELLKTYHQYRNLTIIGISLDGQKTRQTWQTAVDNLPWLQLAPLKLADNPVAVKYDVETSPTNFLIDPKGRIVASDVNGAELEKALDGSNDTLYRP